MDVNGDRSRRKMKIGAREWTCRYARIPAIIERAIGHRIGIGKKLSGILAHDWNPDFVKLSDNLSKPSVTSCPTSDSAFCTIDIGAAPESAFLCCNRIDNHASHGLSSRCVQPADQQQCRILEVANRAEPSKIRIMRESRNLARIRSQHSELRINRSFVACFYGTRSRLIAGIAVGRVNSQRHAF